MRIELTRAALRLSQRVMFAGAFSLLGYCCFVLVNSWLFQGRQRLEFERLIADGPPHAGGSLAPVSTPIVSGGLVGRIEIPSLSFSAILIEGTTRETLQRAVGHIAGTARPGQAGNVGISGHRDTFFRPLRHIHRDDLITLTTLDGRFNYRVVSMRVVDPSEVSVLEGGKGESLTLVTCYPFYFVGPAPDRFVVHAERLM